jgi:creatinine amidohydrolase
MLTLQEMSWVQAEKALANTSFAIVPVGAVEVYGPHLPLGSDGLVALEASRRLAARTGAVITPLVPIGCSQSLMSFPGTLSVSPESLKAYLRDVCSGLVFHGIKRILFMNGHAGNVPAIGDLSREFIARGIRCAQVDWWRAIGRLAVGIADTGDVAVGHAGENCTSVVMAIRPDLVDMSLATREQAQTGLSGKYPEIMQYDRSYRDITKSGMTGDATTATREKGEAMINRFVDKAEAFLKEWK